MNPIYLDHAATTPVDPTVLQVMQPYYTELFYNPSAPYQAARQVKAAVTEARSNLAQQIGARSNEIIFTAGGTEANNLAIHGVMQQFPGHELLVGATEHDSVLAPAKQYAATHIPVHPDGRTDLAALEANISDKTVLISIQYVNNEIGTIQPIKDIAQMIASIKKDRHLRGVTLPLYFHTDACQAGNYLDLHVSRLGVDLMTFNASKIYGPKQIGALYVRSGTQLQPQILGGGQERGQRSGTENVPAIIGFSHAFQLVQERRHSESERLALLQDQFIAALSQQFPGVIVNGSRKHRIVNNIHITIPGYDNETLMMQLDAVGIMCAVGSACSASSEEPSHVLTSIGLDDASAQSSLRFTMGMSTTANDITRVIDELTKIVK